ncbi:MAG TPA: potassium channel family protein [Candidatus Binatia bacterium]|nr:potassium channel family protein [Candidatus Binatia bacterium]
MGAWWRDDRGLSVLLASLVTINFFLPLFRDRPEANLLVQLFFTLVFASGLASETRSRAERIAGALVFAVAVALHWIDYFQPDAGLAVWVSLTRVLAVAVLIVLVVRHVFREGPITVQRIQGAVAVYLLLGVLWAGLYEMIHTLSPAAFRFAEPPQTHAELVTSLAYYSFVTLTTMGYGDITPVHPAARSAAMLEALTGQLFPAILIARLVAMELAAREDRAAIDR